MRCLSLRDLLVVIVLLVATSLTVLSQGGSNYSTFGFGDLRQSMGAAYEGMGGAVYGTPSDYAINVSNPAMWTNVKSTRLQGGYRFNQQLVTQGSNSVGNNNGKLDGATVMFALDTTVGVSACVGLYPSSSVNYSFIKKISVPVPGSSPITGTSSYSGSGGMVTGFLGGAFDVGDKWSFGASALIHFGQIKDRVDTKLESEDALTSINSNIDHLVAAGINIGVQARPTEDLTVGAAVVLNGRMSYASDLRYITGQEGGIVSYDSTTTSDHSSGMPMTLGLGASYRSGKFLFVGDVELQNFSSVDYRMTGAGRYANATRVGLGVSRIGSRSAGVSYFDRLNYNFGVGRRDLNYSFNAQQISELYGTVGAQMPFGGAAMLDVALVFGSRGSTDNNLINEKFLRLNVCISVGETWFIPFKRE